MNAPSKQVRAPTAGWRTVTLDRSTIGERGISNRIESIRRSVQSSMHSFDVLDADNFWSPARVWMYGGGRVDHDWNFRLTGADALEVIRRIPDQSIDLVITDPPYESLEKHRKVGTTTRLRASKASSNKWFDIFPNARFSELFQQLYRVMSKNSHLYLFCDAETMFVVKPMAEACGFRFWKPLVWDKVFIGMGYHYRARYEFVLFFEKGKRKLNNLGISDIISAPRITRGYPTEKPPEVADVLIRQSTTPGELVFDPFMGSGSVGVAALRNGRRFWGNDTCDEAVTIGRARLMALAGIEDLETKSATADEQRMLAIG